MGLLNYTTTIGPEKSIDEVRKRLVAFGVGRFSVSYDGHRRPVSVEFDAPTAFGPRTFRLPANLPGVLAVLQRQARARKVAPRYATPEQAARVAWRIVVEWLKVQLALVELGVAPLDEVLCANMIGARGRTVYETVREQQLSLGPPR